MKVDGSRTNNSNKDQRLAECKSQVILQGDMYLKSSVSGTSGRELLETKKELCTQGGSKKHEAHVSQKQQPSGVARQGGTYGTEKEAETTSLL